jgi:hypothetical protein
VLLIIRGVFEWQSSQAKAVGRRGYQQRMAVVLGANEYIIEKAVGFEGIPIRSVLSNKYLILYPFLDLLYTERLSVSCNSRISSEISWTQHVPPQIACPLSPATTYAPCVLVSNTIPPSSALGVQGLSGNSRRGFNAGNLEEVS